MISTSVALPRSRATGATASAGFLAASIAAASAKVGRSRSAGTGASGQGSGRPRQRCHRDHLKEPATFAHPIAHLTPIDVRSSPCAGPLRSEQADAGHRE
jgi:hypothetical protein